MAKDTPLRPILKQDRKKSVKKTVRFNLDREADIPKQSKTKKRIRNDSELYLAASSFILVFITLPTAAVTVLLAIAWVTVFFFTPLSIPMLSILTVAIPAGICLLSIVISAVIAHYGNTPTLVVDQRQAAPVAEQGTDPTRYSPQTTRRDQPRGDNEYRKEV